MSQKQKRKMSNPASHNNFIAPHHMVQMNVAMAQMSEAQIQVTEGGTQQQLVAMAPISNNMDTTNDLQTANRNFNTSIGETTTGTILINNGSVVAEEASNSMNNTAATSGVMREASSSHHAYAPPGREPASSHHAYAPPGREQASLEQSNSGRVQELVRSAEGGGFRNANNNDNSIAGGFVTAVETAATNSTTKRNPSGGAHDAAVVIPRSDINTVSNNSATINNVSACTSSSGDQQLREVRETNNNNYSAPPPVNNSSTKQGLSLRELLLQTIANAGEEDLMRLIAGTSPLVPSGTMLSSANASPTEAAGNVARGGSLQTTGAPVGSTNTRDSYDESGGGGKNDAGGDGGKNDTRTTSVGRGTNMNISNSSDGGLWKPQLVSSPQVPQLHEAGEKIVPQVDSTTFPERTGSEKPAEEVQVQLPEAKSEQNADSPGNAESSKPTSPKRNRRRGKNKNAEDKPPPEGNSATQEVVSRTNQEKVPTVVKGEEEANDASPEKTGTLVAAAEEVNPPPEAPEEVRGVGSSTKKYNNRPEEDLVPIINAAIPVNSNINMNPPGTINNPGNQKAQGAPVVTRVVTEKTEMKSSAVASPISLVVGGGGGSPKRNNNTTSFPSPRKVVYSDRRKEIVYEEDSKLSGSETNSVVEGNGINEETGIVGGAVGSGGNNVPAGTWNPGLVLFLRVFLSKSEVYYNIS